MSTSVSEANHARLIDWARLTRIPNVFSALSNVSMGYILVESGAIRVPLWIALGLISTAAYCAGMILNDVFDYDQDRLECPDRPLPAGRISRRTAAWVGAALLGFGVAVTVIMVQFYPSQAPPLFQPIAIVVALGIVIVLYDGPLKRTPVGPFMMGACRFLNILLGMSFVREAGVLENVGTLMIPGAIGIYVVGITWYARNEAGVSRRPPLMSGLVFMLLGITMLTLVPLQNGFPHPRVVFASAWGWPLMIWLLTAPVWRRAIQGLISTRSEDIQAAVTQSLRSLIVIDAAIVLVAAGPALAIATLCLLIPATLLGRKFYST